MQLLPKEPIQKFTDLVNTEHLRVHFSQLGEDCALWHYFHARKNGFYVDAGCHHPHRYSNTHLLSQFLNWRGINIDADERAIEAFRLVRPRDINLCVGVGLVEECRAFTVFKDGAVNTFDSKIASHQSATFGQGDVKQMKIRRLQDILAEHVTEPIDYMNVDCEGLDKEVLQSNDWTRFRPEIVSVEIHGLNLESILAHPIVALMKDNRYKMASYYFATAFFERT